jgi:dUTP pyrophosphatase
MQKKIPIPLQVERNDLTPVYATQGAAGADLKANITAPLLLEKGMTLSIPTGVKLQIPEGFEVQIRSRSGLAAKHGVAVLNAPGTIDSDYRGEIHVLLINHGKNSFEITPGMRVAQMVLAPVYVAEFVNEEALSATGRGEAGFGSTGW